MILRIRCLPQGLRIRAATVQITQDEPLLDVADSLKTAEVIKDKYAFILKVRIGGYADDIQPGTYQIAPSDTNQEIIEIITGNGKSSSGDSSGDSSDDSSGEDSAEE